MIQRLSPTRMTLCALATFAFMTGCASRASLVQRDISEVKSESIPSVLIARGDAFAAVGDMTRAEQYFVAAVRNGGSSQLLVRRLIAVCASDNRYPVALDYAEDYLRNHPADIDVRYAAATLRIAIGDVVRARVELDRVLAEKPSFGEGIYVLALLHERTGNSSEAERQFKAYLSADPEGPHAEAARAHIASVEQ